MAQYHTSSDGKVDQHKPGPQTDHTPMPSSQAPKPQNIDDLPGVKAYIDAQDKKAGR